ncbi:MAG: acyl carrier protein [Lachnospiraceae bacterium]|nr:acyl carrier protein [Lachnospiraceae bacterium]
MSSEFEEIRRITAEVLGVDENDIRERTLLAEDLGADSLELFEILTRVEEAYKIALPREAAGEIRTAGDAAALLIDTEHRNL